MVLWIFFVFFGLPGGSLFFSWLVFRTMFFRIGPFGSQGLWGHSLEIRWVLWRLGRFLEKMQGSQK